MKLRASALLALCVLAFPAAAQADLVLPPDPSSKPAADPPPDGDSGSAEKPPASDSPAGDPPGDAPAADPTSSVQGPPKGGCASCNVGEATSRDAALPLLLAAGAFVIALRRRR